MKPPLSPSQYAAIPSPRRPPPPPPTPPPPECSTFSSHRNVLRRIVDPASSHRLRRQLSSKNPPIVYASLLQVCLSFPLGLQLHAQLLKSGLVSDRFVSNSLISLYFRLCPRPSLVRRLFRSLPSRDVVSWTSMITLHLRAGQPLRSLLLFSDMARSGILPNAFTLSAALKACAAVPHLSLGRCLHASTLARGFLSNRVVSSALIDMYGRSSVSGDALRMFGEMLEPDAVCWTSTISALTRNDRFGDAVGLFYSMVRADEEPDGFTFGTVLTALGNLARTKQGREVHARVVVSGLCGNVVVESSVVDMYAKCKLMDESCRVFDRMPTKNAVSWCALLGGYCQSGEFETVLALFRHMDKEGEHYSFGTVLRACAGLAAVRQGKEIHGRYLRTGGWRDVIVESALVDLFAKCGLIDYAYRVFVKILERNLITWNAMICGFAQNGKAMQAVELFDEMVIKGITPDYISFIGVLFACSHTGMVNEGREYFRSMTRDYEIAPGIEHYNCMVDLLSRVGALEEAEDLVKSSIFKDDSSLWASLLGACATYSNPAVAERVAKKMMELEPGYHLSYVLLTNVYKKVGRWEDALKIGKLMRERGVRKAAGKSWIEVKRGSISAYLGSADFVRSELPEFEDSNSDGETMSSL